MTRKSFSSPASVRTEPMWLRAAGIRTRFASYYQFLQPLGRKAKKPGYWLLVVVLRQLHTGERRNQTPIFYSSANLLFAPRQSILTC